MKLDREMVTERIREAKPPAFTTGDLISTVTMLANRLYVHDHAAHRPRIDEVRRFLRAHYGGRTAVEATIRNAMREAFAAGIYAASDADYVPSDPEIARLLAEARAGMTRTATPETDQSLQAPQG